MDNKNLEKQYDQYLNSLKLSSRNSPVEIFTFEGFIYDVKIKRIKKIIVYLVLLIVLLIEVSSVFNVDKMVKDNDLYLLHKLESLSLFDWEDLNEHHLGTAIIYKNFDLFCEILKKNNTIKVRPLLHWVDRLSASNKAMECIRSDERFTPLTLGREKYPDSVFFISKNLTELEAGLKLGANPNKWYFYGYKRTEIPEYISIPTKVTTTCNSYRVGNRFASTTCSSHSISVEYDYIHFHEGISLVDAREMEKKYQSKNKFSVEVSLKLKMLKMYYWPLDYAMKSNDTKIVNLLKKYGAKSSSRKKGAILNDIILL